MRRRALALLIMSMTLFSAPPAAAAPSDLARLTLAAPIILRATIDRAARVEGVAAAGLEPGMQRFYAEAAVTALITAPSAVAARVAYLVDVPVDGRGRAPRLKGADVLLFLRGVTAKPGQFQIAAVGGQRAWTAADEASVRRLAGEKADPRLADLALTGVGDAFRVEGTVPGEAETQIFLRTASGAPIALVVLSRPGTARQVQVATGDVIDEAAEPLRPGSLLWYHVACTLPPALPAEAGAELSEAERAAVADDYRFAISSTPCDAG